MADNFENTEQSKAFRAVPNSVYRELVGSCNHAVMICRVNDQRRCVLCDINASAARLEGLSRRDLLQTVKRAIAGRQG